jgi:ADP-heptose:LPS heptosyltransferase
MKVPNLVRKIGHIVWWRYYVRLIHPVADRLATRWGWPSRLVRWPIPALVPFRRHRLDVVRLGALGDVLMCTPALRELKRRNPTCHLTLYTDFQDLAATFPFIDHVRPTGEAPRDAIWMFYGTTIPPRRHLARILADCLGLDIKDIRPTCIIDSAEKSRFQEAWKDLPRPWILVVRRAGSYTPNKDWPDEYWETLIDRLLTGCTVIDAGATSGDRRPRFEPNYIDLVGRTALPQLIAAIAAADLLVAPETGPMHIAAAVETPAVVIFGGYIHPVSSGYPENINLYSPVPCAPCWLREPCPYGKKCLHLITPAIVESAVSRLWHERRQSLSQRSGELTRQSEKPWPTPVL